MCRLEDSERCLLRMERARYLIIFPLSASGRRKEAASDLLHPPGGRAQK